MFSFSWLKVAIIAALTFVCSIVDDLRKTVDGSTTPVVTNAVNAAHEP